MNDLDFDGDNRFLDLAVAAFQFALDHMTQETASSPRFGESRAGQYTVELLAYTLGVHGQYLTCYCRAEETCKYVRSRSPDEKRPIRGILWILF
jgi:hypothetical protein